MIDRRTAALAAALGIAGTACSDDDPCAGAGTCVRLDVAAAAVAPIPRIDQLELDVVYGDHHATTTTEAAGGRTTALPLATAIVLDVSGSAAVRVGVVAAGKLGASVLGTGAGSTMVAPGHHAAIAIELSPTADCNAGAFYCGGDLLAGDPATLYQCNAGGVPIARGVCSAGCLVRPAHDDVCRGSGGACVDGSHYCGGDKLDGDPQTLYVCMAGAGITPQRCAAGCAIRPGNDDVCR
ncbi:MAG TPA: hypothetical protein VHW23_01315 [Kofleriaceae bacterium]|jgi:hypothetical protein|nr:hypothetical protein [Kofleriaceae bacterium]